MLIAALRDLQSRTRRFVIAIVGTDPVMCATLFTRTADASWHSKVLWDTTAPRLQGFAEPSRFHF